MQKIILLIMIIIFISISKVSAESDFSCTVIKIHDGDTFTCADNTKIRVWGVDTPEISPKVRIPQPGGIEARNYLQNKILNKTLSCSKKGKSYKRIVAKCSVNNEDLAVLLLKNRLAKEVFKYSKGYYSDRGF